MLQSLSIAPDALRRRLEQSDFEFRAVPHAEFSARGAGIVVTLYRSGKLVIQGADPATFAAHHLGLAVGAPALARGPADPGDERAMIGSDECGKGDFFGPLVVASVRIGAGDAAKLREGGVADSKRLGDETVRRLAGAIRSRFAHAIEVLDPSDYNERWSRVRNLNEVLADAHARAIGRLAEPGLLVLVDQFANERLLVKRLEPARVELRQQPRAEAFMAVAAASILARDAFVARLDELSEEFAIDLHKGAGEPVDRAARRFVALHGLDRLGQVAKLHFANAAKLRAAPPEP